MPQPKERYQYGLGIKAPMPKDVRSSGTRSLLPKRQCDPARGKGTKINLTKATIWALGTNNNNLPTTNNSVIYPSFRNSDFHHARVSTCPTHAFALRRFAHHAPFNPYFLKSSNVHPPRLRSACSSPYLVILSYHPSSIRLGSSRTRRLSDDSRPRVDRI